MAAEFAVDAGAVGQRVFPLNGVNAGPGHMKHLPGEAFVDQYREMGIPLVRTHDYYGPCDLSQIYPVGFGPTSIMPVDPYRSAETDATISEIEAAGCEVMFRLGESWDNDDPKNEIPADFGAVATVCKEIVAHYGGHECTPHKCRIRLWEIWNEPDHSMFWDIEEDPDCDQFIEMYVEVARALRDEFPWITIGGPGAKGADCEHQTDLATRLAEACREGGAPLDFFSWHSYNADREGPYTFAKRAQEIRQALNAAGTGKTRNVLGEWNVAHYKPASGGLTAEDEKWNGMLGDMDGAAFSAAALIYLHLYSDVRYACRYRGDYWQPEDGYGLINADGSLKKPGWALKAYAGLFPQRGARGMSLLSATGGDTGSNGAASQCRAVMATIDAGRMVVNVLISLWGHGSEGFSLSVTDLPAGWQKPMMAHYVVSEQADYRERRKRDISQAYLQTGSYSYICKRVADTNSSVHLVRLYDAARFPALAGDPAPGLAGPDEPRRPGAFRPGRGDRRGGR